MGLRSQNNPIASFRDVFSATGKDALLPSPPPPEPSTTEVTGGTITEYIDPSNGNIYKAHTFTSPGNFEVTSLADGLSSLTVECLLVGGGGGGGAKSDNANNSGGGGGGAGAFRTGSAPVSVQTYPIVVGTPGSTRPNADPSPNSNGGPSSAFGLTAGGGGGGGSGYGPWYPTPGKGEGAPSAEGSGGGGGGDCGPHVPGGSSGTYGNPGGSGTDNSGPDAGGGGGGSGNAGGNAAPPGGPNSTFGGMGGVGTENTYRYGPGLPQWYAVAVVVEWVKLMVSYCDTDL